jgi:hypothetical protein
MTCTHQPEVEEQMDARPIARDSPHLLLKQRQETLKRRFDTSDLRPGHECGRIREQPVEKRRQELRLRFEMKMNQAVAQSGLRRHSPDRQSFQTVRGRDVHGRRQDLLLPIRLRRLLSGHNSSIDPLSNTGYFELLLDGGSTATTRPGIGSPKESPSRRMSRLRVTAADECRGGCWYRSY